LLNDLKRFTGQHGPEDAKLSDDIW
jgi:hypothetical protein